MTEINVSLLQLFRKISTRISLFFLHILTHLQDKIFVLLIILFGEKLCRKNNKLEDSNIC